MSDYSIYAQRRAKLIKQMQAGVAVIPTANERVRNRDTHYPYRFDSYFYYLSGFAEPGATLVLIGGKKPRSILFCRDKDPEREVWDGYRYGPEQAREHFGFDEGHSLTKLNELMPRLLADQPVLHYAMGMDEQWDARIVSWLNSVRGQSRSGIAAPAEIRDVRQILDEMRLIKGGHELALMRRAAEISASAHCRAMRATRPGKKEFEIEAELMHEFRRRGAQAPAYTPIVAGGANACVLHYVENAATLRDGDLLLIDAGCELDGYASDVTRTFPVNGRFKGPQKDIYQMVLAAQATAISAVKPGNAWDRPHSAALKVLAQGMIDLGLCKGSLEKVLESGDYKRFYMHRTGHWLGLDVHDAGDYKRGGKWRELKPGMVLTVEPGCYVRPGKDVPEKFWNIGVRIEDDVLVTAKGREVLTGAAPKKIEDIEKLMQANAA
ncbi:MAG TPA: aminopeptidase P N-terminal domain-containing protein [Burkholderiales bacterium]|nr:aminopeptidase P N-terminal domain-containing protein [Burkholderiales bacterium]